MKKRMKSDMENGYVNRYDKLLGEIDRIRVEDDIRITNKGPKEIISYYRKKVKWLIKKA